jgi:hypothetical protein
VEAFTRQRELPRKITGYDSYLSSHWNMRNSQTWSNARNAVKLAGSFLPGELQVSRI